MKFVGGCFVHHCAAWEWRTESSEMSQLEYDDRQIQRNLEREGWYLQHEALDRTWQDMQETEMVPTKIVEKEDLEASIRQELLDSDLRKIGAPCLPDPRTLQQLTKIRGPIVLQVVSISNVAESSKKSCITGHMNNRLLRIRLTDGHSSVTAVEHQPIESLSQDIPPGTKVLLRGMVTVHSGILMLDAQSIRILGGHVIALHEAWEVDRKYSGLARSTAPKGLADGTSGPPPFRPFRSTKKVPHDMYHITAASQAGSTTDLASDCEVVKVASLKPIVVADQQDWNETEHSHSVAATSSRKAGGRVKPGSEPYKPRSVQTAEVPTVTTGNLTTDRRGRVALGPDSPIQGDRGVRALEQAQQPTFRDSLPAGALAQEKAQIVSSNSTQVDAAPAESVTTTSPRKSSHGNGYEKAAYGYEKAYAMKQVATTTAPEMAPVQNRAAAQKLLGKWAADEGGRRGRGRGGVDSAEGRGRERGGRRGRRVEEDDEQLLTWDEWEARKIPFFSAPPAPDLALPTADLLKRDEDLARRLQERLDLETAKVQKTLDEAEQLRLSMFKYDGDDQELEDSFGGGRGRGRGRGRGQGRGGRGRGRGGRGRGR